MNGTAMSEAAMLASLRDIRLPAEAAGGWPAELAVAVGFGALAALTLVAILRLFSQKGARDFDLPLSDQLSALSDQPEPMRRVALLHLLRVHAPDRFAALKGDLYRPGSDTEPGLDMARLEAEVARLV